MRLRLIRKISNSSLNPEIGDNQKNFPEFSSVTAVLSPITGKTIRTPNRGTMSLSINLLFSHDLLRSMGIY